MIASQFGAHQPASSLADIPDPVDPPGGGQLVRRVLGFVLTAGEASTTKWRGEINRRVLSMIEGISAVTLGTYEMLQAVRFYGTLVFAVLHGGEDSSFTSFRAGTSYLNLIAQPAERRWSW